MFQLSITSTLKRSPPVSCDPASHPLPPEELLSTGVMRHAPAADKPHPILVGIDKQLTFCYRIRRSAQWRRGNGHAFV